MLAAIVSVLFNLEHFQIYTFNKKAFGWLEEIHLYHSNTLRLCVDCQAMLTEHVQGLYSELTCNIHIIV